MSLGLGEAPVRWPDRTWANTSSIRRLTNVARDPWNAEKSSDGKARNGLGCRPTALT